jgi:hypothetical protein|tara:strand:- start:218 stop:547 length:330 start_codon:yes stop_codon:yes gene_type:complete
MSFHKIKDSIPDRNISELLFDKNGNRIEVAKSKDTYGKIRSVDDGQKLYLVKVLQSNLYDPIGTYSNRRRYLESSFKKVSKDTFDFYMMYLKTNNSIYLTKAQRGFLND